MYCFTPTETEHDIKRQRKTGVRCDQKRTKVKHGFPKAYLDQALPTWVRKMKSQSAPDKTQTSKAKCANYGWLGRTSRHSLLLSQLFFCHQLGKTAGSRGGLTATRACALPDQTWHTSNSGMSPPDQTVKFKNKLLNMHWICCIIMRVTVTIIGIICMAIWSNQQNALSPPPPL